MTLIELILRNQFISSLLGVGYDSDREKALSLVLFISSLLLACASLYTTFVGLHQYVPAVIALLIALGMNGLLYAASWRLGVMFISNQLKPALPVIFICTFAASVFFSYSALLDSIYDKSSRERDELRRSKVQAEKLGQHLTQLLKRNSDYDIAVNNIRKSLNNWYSSTVEAYSGQVNTLRAELNQNKERYNQTLIRIERLRSQPSTPYRNELLERNAAVGQSLLENKIIPITPQVDRIDPAKETFDKAYNDLIQSNETLTVNRFTEMVTAYKKFVSELTVGSRSKVRIVEIPSELQDSIGDFDNLNKFFQWQEKEFVVGKQETIEGLKALMFEYVNRLPRAIKSVQNDAEVSAVLGQIDTIGRYGGQNAHPFVLAVGELGNGNYLATGSLVIAIAIDGLVLLCGLLGAHPSSFLTMRRTQDLDDALESGFAAIMALNLKGRQPSGNAFIDKIVKLLSSCEPNIQATVEIAIPAAISIETIRHEQLTHEVGMLLASGLAKRHSSEEKIGLTLRLILWMADQVHRHDLGLPTASGFRPQRR